MKKWSKPEIREIKPVKNTVTAFFPGIGKVEISKERAQQILRLQKLIKEQSNKC